MTLETWRLDTSTQTLVLASSKRRMPTIVYWGEPLPLSADLRTLFEATERDLTGGMLDQNPEISISPESSRSFGGASGLRVRRLTGERMFPRWELSSLDLSHKGLTLNCQDQDSELTYTAYFEASSTSGLIKTRCSLQSPEPILIEWLAAPVVEISAYAEEIIDFSGRWCGEFQEQHIPWRFGAHQRHNPTGRTGHEHFPGVIIPELGTTNTLGRCHALHYGWSGGHEMIAEQLPDGRRQLQFGHAQGGELAALTRADSAWLYMAFSKTGINGCSIQFQREVRDSLIKPTQAGTPRPVHYNCWEAVYFDHKLDELKEIAARAAALGAERFVLDDGWFGTRDDDTQSLGDWWIDLRKYPDGLAPLIHEVNRLNMQFGLWFEPEMINENSDTYRAHPDWVLGPHDQIPGRQQRVLDMARTEVQEYLYEHIAGLLAQYRIDYIKWDHNRVLPIYDHDQIRGTYALLQRLREEFPQVEIESCSSGGGRIDFGILELTQRVWLSDSNDAIERARIQANAARFLPACVTGSHVGPRHCHTSGRSLSIEFRGWIAAQRHLGFEMDPRELDEHETEVLQRITQWWKNERAFLMTADIHRLDSIDPSVLAEQHMDAYAQRFILFANKIDTSPQIAPTPLRLTGLEPDSDYRLKLINRSELHHLSRGMTAIKHGDLAMSGRALMTLGLALPWSFPCQTWVVVGEKFSG